MENLEDRELFVVGAFALAPAVLPGSGFDGVVEVNGGCSGSLLYTGRHVLTAAHCVDFDVDTDGDGNNDRGNGRVDGAISVDFDMPGGRVSMNVPADNVILRDDWDGDWHHNDIAILELPSVAPLGAEGYEIYEQHDEVGGVVTLVGYGRTGTGAAGNDPTTYGTKRVAQNMVDQNDDEWFLVMDSDNPNTDWSLPENAVEMATIGNTEGLISRGDSGGPAFLDGEVAGVASYVSGNSSFGDNSWHTRVSCYAEWIHDQIDGIYDLTFDMTAQVAGDNGIDDTIVLTEENGLTVIEVNGLPYFSDQSANIQSVTIVGSGDRDDISAPIDMEVTVRARGGADSLSVTGDMPAITTWNVTEHRGGTVGAIEFIGIDHLYGSPNKDRFVIDGGTMLSAQGRAGADNFIIRNGGELAGAYGDEGNDRLAVQRHEGQTNWTIHRPNRGQVLDGPLFFDVERLAGGDADDHFLFRVGGRAGSVDGAGGENTLEIHGEQGGTSWTVSDANAGTANRINGGRRATHFTNIDHLNGGILKDNFTFEPGGRAASVDGAGGENSLEIQGAPGRTSWTVSEINGGTASQIIGGQLLTDFANVEHLRGGIHRDAFVVQDAGTISSINGGAGLNLDSLHILDGTLNNTWLVTADDAGTVTDNAGVRVDSFTSIESLIGDEIADHFRFENASHLSDTVDGRGGMDTLEIVESPGHWFLDNLNRGRVVDSSTNDTITSFVSVENLQGGRYDDRFFLGVNHLGSTMGVDGSIDGGDGEGSDWLDYSHSYGLAGVLVDLGTGEATSVDNGNPGKVRQIENVRGSRFHDIIFGDDRANILEGLEGEDFLDGLMDGQQDILNGGADADDFVQHQQIWMIGPEAFMFFDEDLLVDVNENEGDEVL